MNNGHTTHTSFLLILILLTVITVKMAFLYSAELLFILLISIPGILVMLYLDNQRDEMDESP